MVVVKKGMVCPLWGKRGENSLGVFTTQAQKFAVKVSSMAYLKKVKSKGRTYEYWVENTRVNGRTVQKYLGKAGESKVVKAYRENIGRGDPVGPILREEIRKAEGQYPEDWLLKAIREATLKTNRPSWSYIVSMLNRYRREDDGNPEPPPSKMELNEVADEVMYNLKREMELCPRCGREASHFNLLLKTCPHCGHKLTGPELEELQATRQRKSREKKKKTDEDYERSSNV